MKKIPCTSYFSGPSFIDIHDSCLITSVSVDNDDIVKFYIEERCINERPVSEMVILCNAEYINTIFQTFAEYVECYVSLYFKIVSIESNKGVCNCKDLFLYGCRCEKIKFSDDFWYRKVIK